MNFLEGMSGEDQQLYYGIHVDTSKDNIKSYGRGKSLTKLTSAAEKALKKVGSFNPSMPQYVTDVDKQENDLKKGKQMDLDCISDIKKRLATAIEYKKTYYENHWFGIITKYFLKIIGKWNKGVTPSIAKAGKLLRDWDSNNHNLGTVVTSFHPLIWGKDKLDFTNFYNYSPVKA